MSLVSVNGVSVTLAVTHGPYQKTLATSLLRAGMLRRVLRSRPFLEVEEPGPDGSLGVIRRFPSRAFANRAFWGSLNRLPRRVRPEWPAIVADWLTDRLRSRWIPPCSVFHTMWGSHLASLRAAKRQGATTLLENPGCHFRRMNDVPAEEAQRFGLDPRQYRPPGVAVAVRRIEREYEFCDCIAVPSAVAHRSFVESGFGAKAFVVTTGVDTDFFFPPQPTQERSRFRVCYVGRLELAKGLGYLLQAWKRLGLREAELVLAGGVKPEMKSLLATYGDSTVRLTRWLPQDELAKFYRESDLFVMPSVNEGLAQVLLEAMASGLPVVASDLSGACDCIASGKEGIIVPARNVDALADAILWCYQHRDESREMGRAARARIESQFTLEHYNQRMIALYRSLAA